MDRPQRPRVRWFLSGKISNDDRWRDGIVPALAYHSKGWWRTVTEENDTADWPVLSGAVWSCEHWDYVGPFYAFGLIPAEREDLYCGHCSSTGFHLTDLAHNGNLRGPVHRQCLRAIGECDILFAWLNDMAAYGTLVEIGYAAALGKKIVVAANGEEDLWFAQSCQNFGPLIPPCRTAREAFIYLDQWIWSSWKERVLKEDIDGLRQQLVAAREPCLPMQSTVRLDPQRTFSNGQRQEIYLRSNGHCVGCGAPLDSDWHADHIFPHSRGGKTEVINGQALCRSCNGRKSAKVLTVDGVEE